MHTYILPWEVHSHVSRKVGHSAFSAPHVYQWPRFHLKIGLDIRHQWRSHAGSSQEGDSPTRRAKMRKKISKVWGKIIKKKNWSKFEEKMKKVELFAHPGLRGWLRPYRSGFCEMLFFFFFFFFFFLMNFSFGLPIGCQKVLIMHPDLHVQKYWLT